MVVVLEIVRSHFNNLGKIKFLWASVMTLKLLWVENFHDLVGYYIKGEREELRFLIWKIDYGTD